MIVGRKLATGTDALALLRELEVSPRLLRHHELVLEAAVALTDGLVRELGAKFDAGLVHVGAALHDVGKSLHPNELHEPGHAHESAGRALLISQRVPEHVARFCVTHASWDSPTLALEDLLVALADKLWKGKREPTLERRVVDRLAAQLDCLHGRGDRPYSAFGLRAGSLRAPRADLPAWRVFELADAVFEAVAEPADARLARSLA